MGTVESSPPSVPLFSEHRIRLPQTLDLAISPSFVRLQPLVLGAEFVALNY
jgi:hypothetical protein